ncbi:hypothetical protein BOX15_Mlig008630g1 [Macrostomum lignano]|uniref:Poly [ADP-ribose] polymerase n=1 Tax=Macrostomum lignano TaxID=282301 RepID=A0A267E2J5_9PLAT|nr:hypothetical protein BOX15_Mlig008630g1 [Macrostomum lignano]
MSKRNKTPLKRFGYDDAVEEAAPVKKKRPSQSGGAGASARAEMKPAIYSKGDFVAVKSDGVEEDFFVGLLEEALLSNDQTVGVFWLKTKDGVNYEWEFRDSVNARAIITRIKLRKLSKNKFRLAAKTKSFILENVKRCQSGQDPFEFHSEDEDGDDGEEAPEEAMDAEDESDNEHSSADTVDVEPKPASKPKVTATPKAKAAVKTADKRRRTTSASATAASDSAAGEAAGASSSGAGASPKPQQQRRPALKKTATQREREKQQREAKKVEREEKKQEREEKKQEKEAERQKKREEREERLGKWTLQPRPSVVVLDTDPFFSAASLNDVPFVSPLNYSKLFITAALTNNMTMLNELFAQPEKAPAVFIQRSVALRQNALSVAIESNNVAMLRVIFEEANKSSAKRTATIENLSTCDISLETGVYNPHSLGLARIRRINVSRGSREGNNALTKDANRAAGPLCHPTSAWRPAINMAINASSVTMATVDTVFSLAGMQGNFKYNSLFDKVYLILRRGNRGLASALVDEMLKQPMQNGGFGSLHGKALRANKPEDLGKFRAISISKSAFTNKKVTPLHCAAINPNRAILDSLLNIFPDFTVADEHGWKLIHYASANSKPDCLAMLLDRGVSIYEVSRDGILALHVAAKCGRFDSVRLLLAEALKQRRKRDAESAAAASAQRKTNNTTNNSSGNNDEDDSAMATASSTMLGDGDAATAADAAKSAAAAADSDEDEAVEDSAQLSEQRWGLAGINRPNRLSHTPLHLAAMGGHASVLRVFVEFKDSIGLSVDLATSAGRNKMTALHLASEAGHLDCVRLLVEQLRADTECQDRLRRTPITHAVLNGHSQVAAYLLTRGANPNRRDSSGNTLLHYAAAYGWYHCVRLLLEHGAKPGCLNDWKLSPLAIVFLKGHMGLVPLIVKQPGVDIDAVDDSGRSLLFMACSSRLSESLCKQVRHLVEDMGASVTLTDADGNTPLHLLAANQPRTEQAEDSAERSALAVCDLLLSRGCDPDRANQAGLRPLDVALLNHNFTLLKRLANHSSGASAKPRLADWCEDDTEETTLHKLADQCVEHDFSSVLTELIKLPENRELLQRMVNQRDAKRGYTCLIAALLKYLNVFVAPRNSAENKLSMSNCGLKFIKLLLELGADPGIAVKPENYKPAAANRFSAPRRGRSACYSSAFLADRRGARAPLSPGDTALLVAGTAAKYDSGRCLEAVLARPSASIAALNAYQSSGRTVLQELVLARHLEPAVRILVRSGADVSAPSRSVTDRGETCLMSAVRLLHSEQPADDASEHQPVLATVKLLLENGAPLSAAEDRLGNTALHLLACSPKRTLELESVLDELLRHASPDLVNAANGQGRTALHLAVNYSHLSGNSSTEVEDRLLGAGADPTVLDCRSRTALHYAFVKIGQHDQTAHIDPIQVVSTLCAETNVGHMDRSDRWGATPMHYAAVRGSAVSIVFMNELGIKTDTARADGNTPLTLAAMSGHQNAMVSLLQLGSRLTVPVSLPLQPQPALDYQWLPAKLTAQSKAGSVREWPLLEFALRKNWEGIAYIIVDKLLQSEPFFSILTSCIRSFNYHFVFALMRRHPTKSLSDPQHRSTLLHVLAKAGETNSNFDLQFKLLSLLTEKGVSATAKDARGGLPITYACLRGHYKLAQELLRLKLCQSSAIDGMGRNLLSATFWSYPAYSESLNDWLSTLCSYSWVNMNSQIELPVYTELWHLESSLPPVDYFNRSAESADIKFRSLTPLFVAIYRHDFRLARALLLTHRADVNSKTSVAGRTPLMECVVFNDEDLVRLMLDHDYKPKSMMSADEQLRRRRQRQSPSAFGLPVELDDDAVQSAEAASDYDGGDTDSVDDDSDDSDGDPEFRPDASSEQLRGIRSSPKKRPKKTAAGAGPAAKPRLRRQRTTLRQQCAFARDYTSQAKTSSANLRLPDSAGRGLLDYVIDPWPGVAHDNWRIFLLLVDAGCTIHPTFDSLLQLALDKSASRIARLLQLKRRVPFADWRYPLVGAGAAALQSAPCRHPARPLPPDWDVATDAAAERAVLAKQVGDNAGAAAGSGVGAGGGASDGANRREDRYRPRPDKRCRVAKVELVWDERFAPAKPFTALLSRIDVGCSLSGLYNFYKLQLLRQRGRNFYLLFTCWGRIGDTGQYQTTPFPSRAEAVKEFEKVFRSKTGNRWIDLDKFETRQRKYSLVQLDSMRLQPRLHSLPVSLDTRLPHELPDRLADLMRDLLNPKMLIRSFARCSGEEGHLAFGRVPQESLVKAANLLQKIYVLALEVRKQLKKPKELDINECTEKSRQLAELTNQYYQLVPQTGFEFEAIEPLLSSDHLDAQQAFITNLAELQTACQILLASARRRHTVHPFDYAYRATACDISALGEADTVAQVILRYMSTVPDARVTGIYELCRHADLDAAAAAAAAASSSGSAVAFGQRKLLWHGTSVGNALSILHHGLLLAPPSVSRVGRAFGRGLYFADVFAKSVAYCRNEAGPGSGRQCLFAFLAEVDLTDCQVDWRGSLGKAKQQDGASSEDSDDDADDDGAGANADGEQPPVRHVMGAKVPSPTGDLLLQRLGGVITPLGELASPQPPPGKCVSYTYRLLPHSEYIVSDETRVRIRYLVRFQLGSQGDSRDGEEETEDDEEDDRADQDGDDDDTSDY